MLKAFIKLSEVGIMVCPSYIFVVSKRNSTYFVSDIHVIRNHIGGNGNGIVTEFFNVKSCITWITKRLVLSGVKTSVPQDIFEKQNKSKVMKEVILGIFNPAGRKTKN